MGHVNLNVDAVDMEDVIKTLDRFDLLPSRSMKALEEGAKILLAEEKRLVPLGTHRLHDSLKIGRRKKARSRTAVEVGAFYPDTSIAHLVEHGHGGPKSAGAHPYIEPAIENVGDAVTGAITKELLDAFGSL